MNPNETKSICDYCKKKCGIIIFKCKCELKNLCIKCKSPEDHKCEYDYRKDYKEILKKKNPVVIADKINKI